MVYEILLNHKNNKMVMTYEKGVELILAIFHFYFVLYQWEWYSVKVLLSLPRTCLWFT